LNRYDYTRTYALEFAYLGLASEIKEWRQRMLSCTVENKTKEEQLRAAYARRERQAEHDLVVTAYRDSPIIGHINSRMESLPTCRCGRLSPSRGTSTGEV